MEAASKRPAAAASSLAPAPSQPVTTGTAQALPDSAPGQAEGGFHRVLGVGFLLLVIGLGVLFYSASVLTLTCRSDTDPNPQRAGWCELNEVMGFGWWAAPRRRFLASHFVEAQPEIAFNKVSGRVLLIVSSLRKPLPLGHHRSMPHERTAQLNTLFGERNGGPVQYEEGYSATGMFLGGAMVFTGAYLILTALVRMARGSHTPSAPPARTPSRKEEEEEKKTQ